MLREHLCRRIPPGSRECSPAAHCTQPRPAARRPQARGRCGSPRSDRPRHDPGDSLRGCAPSVVRPAGPNDGSGAERRAPPGTAGGGHRRRPISRFPRAPAPPRDRARHHARIPGVGTAAHHPSRSVGRRLLGVPRALVRGLGRDPKQLQPGPGPGRVSTSAGRRGRPASARAKRRDLPVRLGVPAGLQTQVTRHRRALSGAPDLDQSPGNASPLPDAGDPRPWHARVGGVRRGRELRLGPGAAAIP